MALKHRVRVGLFKHNNHFTGNLTMTLTYGFSDEKAFIKMQEKEQEWMEMFEETGPAATLNMWPFLRFIVPSVRKVYKQFDTTTKHYVDAYKAFTNKRKSEFDGKNPHIYIDHFLNMMDKPVKLGELKSKLQHTLIPRDVKKVKTFCTKRKHFNILRGQ